MISKVLVWLLGTVYLATVSIADAQPTKVPRIGYLSRGDKPTASSRLRRGIRQDESLGMLRRRTSILSFATEGKGERFPNFLAELIKLKIVYWSLGRYKRFAAKKKQRQFPLS
jgi:hypothetical protein